MKIVIFGLTLTSSWGNGHATTYRSLVKALARLGHRIDFVEKDVEWYRSNRDMPHSEYCTIQLYDQWEQAAEKLLRLSADADVVVVGSYFPDAKAATEALLEQGSAPVLFYDIDTPITMAKLRAEGRTEYLDAAAIPRYAAYLSFTGGPALRELEERFGAPRAVAFYCSVDPELYMPAPERELYRCDLSYLGTYAADRQPNLDLYLNGPAGLLPEKEFLVAGPQYPQDLKWPGNVRRMFHVYPGDHPAFYCSSRFTLNLTRADMVAAGYSPSVRLFEASACGAAIISDSWTGLEEFLTPGEEILLPEDARGVAEILTAMPESERVRLGQRARERILAEHTADHRARQFEQIVAQCYAARR